MLNIIYISLTFNVAYKRSVKNKVHKGKNENMFKLLDILSASLFPFRLVAQEMVGKEDRLLR